MPDTNLRCQEQPVALHPSQLERLDDFATIMRCRSGQEIYSQEDPADSWYRVVSGALRRFACVPMAAGRSSISCCPATGSASPPTAKRMLSR